MLKTLRARIAPALWPALIGMMLSLGLILPVLDALSIAAAGTAVFACLLTAALCVCAGLGGRTRWIALIGGGIILFFYLVPSGGLSRMGGMFSAAIHLVQGNAEPLRVYGDEVAVIITILLTAGGRAMARQVAGFYPALSLTIVATLIIWFTGSRESLWLIAPALVALAVLFARSVSENTPYARIVGASALTVLLAIGLTPTLPLSSSSLENFAERMRNYITDTFFFTELRTVYTIQVDGFKPLETRLGGPVNIQERPVMTVETETPLLLRGVTMNYYSGLSWADAVPSRRYLYADPRHRSIRADIMDENRPPDALRGNGLFDPVTITITMQADSATTLFVPGRLAELRTPMTLVPYFNASGEIFITRALQAGDTYSLSAPIISANDARLPSLLAQAAAQASARNMSDYLGLHEYIAADVYSLTENITAGCATPLEKALVIRNYLRNNYYYTLTPDMPPENQDFVSYFLLRGKEGYCTYFASAMAIMGRIAGLPTRYVEGYLVQPMDGIALVTSKKAHAWAEIYFDGFGWIAFDATPSGGMGGGSRPDDGGQHTNDPQPEETPPPESPEPSPSPEPEQQDPLDDPNGGADSTPPDGQEEPTPSPEPDQSTEQPPEPTPPPPDQSSPNDNGQKKPSRWWIWLLLLLLIAALVWRGIWTRPQMVATRQCHSDDERLLLWYRALLGLTTAWEVPALPPESPIQHALRIESALPKDCGLLAVADAVTLLGYGRYGASPAQVEEAQRCYTTLHRSATLPVKARWLARRMLRGIGSVTQVP